MCVEGIIAIISGALFILSELLPYIKLKCDENNNVNTVHEIIKIPYNRIKTKRNLEIV